MPVLFQTEDGPTGGAAIVAVAGAVGVCAMVIVLGLLALIVAGMWKMFAKAGRPGWAAIVPFYSDMIRNEISGIPVVWTYYTWIILALNMFTGGLAGFGAILLLIIQYFTYGPLLKAYGRDNGTGGVLFALFFPYVVFPQIGFGANAYLGPQADAVAALPNLPWIDNTATSSSAPSVGTPINNDPPASAIPSMKGTADDDLNKPQ